jgi:aconitate hydratase 2/2-methylisocitrate dehydratase
MDEYKAAVEGITLTDFAPPLEEMTTAPVEFIAVSNS